MANVKISEMNSATLPLAGDELVEVVQGGQSRKAAVSALGGLKVAHARIANDATLQAGSVNVDGVTVAGAAIYTIDVTSAGFTTIPTPIACWDNLLAGAANGPQIDAHANSTTEIEVQCTQDDGASFPHDFNFFCIGQ